MTALALAQPKGNAPTRHPQPARGWDSAEERAAWKWLIEPNDEIARLAQLILRWRADAIRYANEALRIALTPYQGQILLDLSDAPEEVYLFYGLDPTFQKRKVLAPSGHGLGKTRTTAVAALWHRDTHMLSKTLITAPTSDQITGQLWGEITAMNLRLKQRWALIGEQWDILGSSVVHQNTDYRNWGIWGRTARPEKPEGLQGAHALSEDDKYGDLAAIWGEEPDNGPKGGMLIVCEEASGVDDSIREVLTGSLAEPGARFLAIGNPTRADGWFANDIDKINEYAVHELDCRMSDASKTYTLPYEDFGGNIHTVRIDGFVQPKYWLDILRECDGDENDDYFRRRVAGKKPKSNIDQVIRTHWVEQAMMRAPDPESVRKTAIIGLDFGVNQDKHGLAVRRGFALLEIREWLAPDLPHEQTLAAAQAAIDAQGIFGAKIIIGDANGVGRGAMEYLERYYREKPELGVTVVFFNSGMAALDATRYMRRRDEMWARKGREFFSDPRCSLPNIPGLKTQLCTPGMSEVNRRIKVETKDDIERRTKVKSGNAADAVLHTLMVDPLEIDVKPEPVPVHPAVFVKHFNRLLAAANGGQYVR